MPLNQAETQAFFTEPRQMAIPQDTVDRGIMTEGIANIEDLGKFYDKDFKAIIENLRKPAGSIVDPTDATRRIPTPSSVLGAKSFKRLKVAACAVRYYETVGRECTAANMHFSTVLKNFGNSGKLFFRRKKRMKPTFQR